MSRSITVSTPKNPTRVPSKSAWAQGSTQPTSVSVKDPVNVYATHSQRSQGVSIKDGVKIPRSALKQGSAVTFGSIYDTSAPISPSPAPTSAARSAGGLKSFDSVAAQNVVSDAANTAVTNRPPLLSSTSSSHSASSSTSTLSPVPKFDKKSAADLFAGPSAQSIPTRSHEAASPASRPALSPSQHSHGQSYTHPPLSGALRQGQNGKPSAPPRSSVYFRPIENGQKDGIDVRGDPVQAGSSGTSAGPTPAAIPSPRLTPHAPPSPSSGLPPLQTMWPSYYYYPQLVPSVSPDQFYQPQWSGHIIPPQHQPPSPHHPPGASPPSVALPRSPRNPPIPPQQEERKLNEEAERAEKERKEAEEWAVGRNEANEREKEHLRLEGRAQREAEEKVQREEAQQDRLRKLEARKATEQRHRAEEEALRAAEAGEATGTFADVTSVVIPEKSEIKDEAGEVQQTNTTEESLPSKAASVPTLVAVPTDLPSTFTEEHIGTSLPSPEIPWNNPGSRNLQNITTNNSASTSPSALSTARHIEDINRITYPEGIKRPKIELNVNAQMGKFRYDRDFLLQFMTICKEKPDNLSLLDVIGKRPARLRNFQTAITRDSALALPSALATARHVEGIKNLKDEFDVNTQQGKFCAGTASVVPIESLLSDPYAKPPFAPKASWVRLPGPGTRRASILGMGSSEGETPDTSSWQSDDSFVQHSKYFFKDGNVTFLVDGFLFCVHRYLFSHDSVYFSTRFAQLGVRDHEALSTILSLGDVECKDFEAFLSILYPHFEERDLSYDQWKSVLDLSTRWGFASRRKLALESIEPPTPYDRLVLARKYTVDNWVVPALIALCERTAPLSLEEARGMNIEDVVLVATVREHIFRFGVSAAEIPRRVEAMRAESLIRIAVSLSSSTSGDTEQPSSKANATVDFDLDVRSCNGTKTAATELVNGNTPRSSGNFEGATTESQGEDIEQSDGEPRQTAKVTSNGEWDTHPFKGKKGKPQENEEPGYQTTKVASNDKWDMLPSKKTRVRSKRMNVPHWQTAKGVSNDGSMLFLQRDEGEEAKV